MKALYICKDHPCILRSNFAKFMISFINDQDQLNTEANTKFPPSLVLVTLERCSISTVPKMTEDSLVSFHILKS